MRLVYRQQVNPPIDLMSMPAPETMNGVHVGWDVDATQLRSVSFTVAGIRLELTANGAISLHSLEAEAKVFAVARFVVDRIRLQTGYEVFDPYAFVGNSPSEFDSESSVEEAFLQTHVKHHQRSTRVTIAVSGPFNPDEFKDFEHLAIPLGHFARGKRTTDPLDRYQSYYKALEYFAAKNPGDDPQGGVFDRQLSEIAKLIDARYDETKIKSFRVLRKRMTHARTTHPLGHIGPSDIENIRVVQAELPDVERLVFALLKSPPQFPRP